MKILLMCLLLLSSAFAADKVAVQKALAACGSDDVQFDVHTDKHRHAVAEPDAGKAVLYVVEDQLRLCLFCAATTRVGLDGAWIGANHGRSYFFAQVEPGEHHLCGDWQRLPPVDRIASLAHFTAEAGKTYYFSLRVVPVPESADWFLDLETIDSDEGQLLLASYAWSSWKATTATPSEPDSQGH